MNEKTQQLSGYEQHRKIYILENIAEQYLAGKECAQSLHRIAEQIETRCYRVAVIGEFKRGKSSMINALLGSEILPMDILPATAAVNHIVYGTEEGIEIHYKDGQIEHTDIEKLANYATKLDEEKARTADRIKEIVVTYPSVFCKNAIELYDTPGLNDNDAMTEITLDVLKEIDAAIVVIAATKPFSMTERNLVIKLLERQEIHNIIFVITFIDQVSSRKKEQDRVIEYIKNRISSEVLQQAKMLYGEDTAFMNKARMMLQEPKIFALSSVLALEAFIKDDEELLEESRFPAFKHSLLAVLTAGQSLDIQKKVTAAIEDVTQKLERWNAEEENMLKQKMDENEQKMRECEAYVENSRFQLESIFRVVDSTLEQSGFDSIHGWERESLAQRMRKEFIAALSTLHMGVSAKDIEEALEKALHSCADWMLHEVNPGFKEKMLKELEGKSRYVQKVRQDKYIEAAQAFGELALSEEELLNDDMDFPEFMWSGRLYPEELDLMEAELMTYISESIERTIAEYNEKCLDYISCWRRGLLQQNLRDRALLQEIKVLYEKKKEELKIKKELLKIQYENNKKQLKSLNENQ